MVQNLNKSLPLPIAEQQLSKEPDHTALPRVPLHAVRMTRRSKKRTVRYKLIENPLRRAITLLLAMFAPLLGISYIIWLAAGAYVFFYNTTIQDNWKLAILAASVVIMLVTEIIRLSLVFTMSFSTVLARNPVQQQPQRGLRVALFMTFVPSSEDIGVLERTLRGAKKIDYPNEFLKIFVLDEGFGDLEQKLRNKESLSSDEKDRVHAVARMIKRLNNTYQGHQIIRISRACKPQYHHADGSLATRTKHGNINAAVDMINQNPKKYGTYDIIMGLDPDHRPKKEFVTRMISWFNDPNVAYVAGPQAYRNAMWNWVARLAESQQFVFHSLIQTAANTYGSPMLVGTSYAIRWSVMRQIGGMQSSITEDMATSYKVLTERNPRTNQPWIGVYTGEVLAEGEGPSSWGDFYKQQDRWSRGAIEYLFTGQFGKAMVKMARHHPLRVLHYCLLMAFYPVAAIAWLLTALNTLLYAFAPVEIRIVDPKTWLVFYGWVAVVQIGMYVWSRKNNVSPFEHTASWGFYGMFMSVISAPVYAAALFNTILRKPVGFNVTPKGKHATGDTLYVFRLNLYWGLFYLAVIAAIIIQNHTAPATLAWPIMGLLLSISPIIVWLLSKPWAKRHAAIEQNLIGLITKEDEGDALCENNIAKPSYGHAA